MGCFEFLQGSLKLVVDKANYMLLQVLVLGVRTGQTESCSDKWIKRTGTIKLREWVQWMQSAKQKQNHRTRADNRSQLRALRTQEAQK